MIYRPENLHLTRNRIRNLSCPNHTPTSKAMQGHDTGKHVLPAVRNVTAVKVVSSARFSKSTAYLEETDVTNAISGKIKVQVFDTHASSQLFSGRI